MAQVVAVPPIDLAACEVNVEQVTGAGTRGSVDCSAVPRAVFSNLRFDAQ